MEVLDFGELRDVWSLLETTKEPPCHWLAWSKIHIKLMLTNYLRRQTNNPMVSFRIIQRSIWFTIYGTIYAIIHLQLLEAAEKNNKKPRIQIHGETTPLQCPSHGWSVASASTAWLRSGWRLCRMTLRSLGLRFLFCCKEDWTQKTRSISYNIHIHIIYTYT